ncbi:MAG: glycosyltransferase family 87 protein [Candidatus Limnocylindria bacterium]
MSGPLIRRWTLIAASAIGWVAFMFTTVRYLAVSVALESQQPLFIYLDWRAYATGAGQLLDRTLYRIPLDAGEAPLPLDVFNLPPLAAAAALPFLALDSDGPLAWQLLAAIAVALAAIALGRMLGQSWTGAVLWAGVGLGAYVALDRLAVREELNYWWGLVLGNNGYLMLGLIAAFALAYAAGHWRAAGLLLAVAIGLKVWPLALVPLLVRERSWTTITWAGAALATQALVFVLWLGPEAVPFALAALGERAEVDTLTIGVASVGVFVSWWPAWAPLAACLILALLPARGLTGLGLGILAGLAAITNLWGHYLPTIIFGLVLVAGGLVTAAREQGARREPRSAAEGAIP